MNNLENFINQLHEYTKTFVKDFNKKLKQDEKEYEPFIQTASYIVDMMETKFANELPSLNDEKYQAKLVGTVAIIFINAITIKDEQAIMYKKEIESTIGLNE